MATAKTLTTERALGRDGADEGPDEGPAASAPGRPLVPLRVTSGDKAQLAAWAESLLEKNQ